VELDSWKKDKVYTEVEDVGQKCISTRWVCSLKSTPNGIIPKARLVARGFEEFTANIQKESPTCAHEPLRLIIALTAQHQWELHAMDIKTAFLQGQNMDREVYVVPPKEANSNGIWLLNKCVYGLSDASLYWYKKLKSVVLENGGSMSNLDPTVFYWCDDTNSLVGIFASHIDNFIWSGGAQFERVVNKICAAFKVRREESKAFKYCCIELTSINGEIYLNQDKYTENMTPIKELRSKVGQLLWLAHQSRPDLLFDTCVIPTNIGKCTVKDIHDVNKIIGKAKSSKITLKYQHLGDDNDLCLMIFSDAALRDLTDGGSQGGYVIFLVGKSGKFSPIWWNSKKIRRVVHSTLTAETISMC